MNWTHLLDVRSSDLIQLDLGEKRIVGASRCPFVARREEEPPEPRFPWVCGTLDHALPQPPPLFATHLDLLPLKVPPTAVETGLCASVDEPPGCLCDGVEEEDLGGFVELIEEGEGVWDGEMGEESDDGRCGVGEKGEEDVEEATGSDGREKEDPDAEDEADEPVIWELERRGEMSEEEVGKRGRSSRG